MDHMKVSTRQFVEQIKKQAVAACPSISSGPWPKCGSPLLLKSWKGKYYINAQHNWMKNAKWLTGHMTKGHPWEVIAGSVQGQLYSLNQVLKSV